MLDEKEPLHGEPLENPIETTRVADMPLPPIPQRRNPFVVLWQDFRANLPKKGDRGGVLVRKLLFALSLMLLLISAGYLTMDMWVVPVQNEQLTEELNVLYHPEDSMLVADDGDVYPSGMLAAFKDLYNRNDEVRGWLSFHANGNTDFLNIDHPVLYAGDNEKYLTVDFDQTKNKNGALFFDAANRLDRRDDTNKSLIIYGHNMASGQMFAGLNKLMGNLSNARTAPMLTLSTLYQQSDYLVFAVMVIDEDETKEQWYFNTRRTVFDSDEDFLTYVEDIRARSMFDYPVEVRADDELLVLSTCTNKNSVKLKNGRLVVVARRRRGNEADVDTTMIVKNDDAIMPRNWYVNRQLPLHEYYEGDYDGTASEGNPIPTQSTVPPSDTTDVADTTTTAQNTQGDHSAVGTTYLPVGSGAVSDPLVTEGDFSQVPQTSTPDEPQDTADVSDNSYSDTSIIVDSSAD